MLLAIIILTECDDICGGKIPIIQHEDQNVNWHAWDKYEGNHEVELPIYTYAFLDERYYGKLQGKDKAETTAIYGKEQVHLWRRFYNEPPPGGESLENTQERVIPCSKQRIMPYLAQRDNVLISAHSNSLRAMLMYLNNLTPEQVVELELGTAIPIVYQFNSDGTIQSKQILSA